MIRLSKSVLSEKEVENVKDVILNDGYLGMGNHVKRFEEDIQKFLETKKNILCVNSGTAAVHLALQAAGLKEGDEVLVPSLTYVATYQAISATGATPISCECNPQSGLICLEDAKERLSGKTKAMVYVHYASHTGDLDELYEFGKTHNIRIVEDAAHSFGCTYKGKKVGEVGDIVCFSFDGIKNITSGEGGAIVTADEDVTQHIKDARLLGVENDTEKRYSNSRSWEFDVKIQGWRYHMSNIMAAIGRAQLERFPSEFAPKRIEFRQKYINELKDLPYVELFLQPLAEDSDSLIPHIFPIKVKEGLRDKLRQTLIDEGIQVGIHYLPNHKLEKYKSSYPLPKTEEVYEELLTLPLHPDLTLSDVNFIIRKIRDFKETL